MLASDSSNNTVEEIDIEKLLNTIVTQTDYTKEIALIMIV